MFYIILNLAVGGHFFNEALRNEPHRQPFRFPSKTPMRDFWEKRHEWLPTWQGEKAALCVDYVRVYQNGQAPGRLPSQRLLLPLFASLAYLLGRTV